MKLPEFDGLQVYYGDLHNHCKIGYGHGSVEDAFQNARLQLDFAAVTAHAHWPDIAQVGAHMEKLVAAHLEGFGRTRKEWERLREVVEAQNNPGKLVTFLGFEWHSLEYGDHHILFNGSQGEVLREPTLEGLRGGAAPAGPARYRRVAHSPPHRLQDRLPGYQLGDF